MSKEELRRLFDPFYSTTSGEGRMGLGLFVSQGIVRQHGGTILADSGLGRGSTLTVVLPLERESDNERTLRPEALTQGGLIAEPGAA